MDSNIDNKQVYVRTKTCLIWNILGLAVLLISFTVIAFPEIIILLITLIKREVKVYSLKENNYLIISKRRWKEYRRINNIGFWSQYSLVSVTNIVKQNYHEVNLEKPNIAKQGDHEESAQEIEDISKMVPVKTKRNLRDVDIDITHYLNESTKDEKSSSLSEIFKDSDFSFVKTRLTDRNSKQNKASLNKKNLLPNERQEYENLKNKIKLENNGDANFGVDFNNKVIFIDKLYESESFNKLTFGDLSDVKINQNISDIDFIKKDGNKIKASFIKYPVSEEEKNLDSIILKQLVLKIKSKIS
ncbi:hypothetical protein [Lactobacillus hominis]|uniref:Uncharacterized protein n=1 Tax=Lactobacillus hominis DSM 23910 = CRBIP 24.179 TaxID=1423758 RepID=I7L4U1_9LACO|nr:hypothetical protein [Lactobacillus hominis]KRM86065.1 hypothetical protein FC41_GL000258 [Lactobacillus hominis DSM 23910 = CRBIP 24.179]MCT3348709.1 hypothetical protein [Lactobacillus hominis]CCI80977.1 Putative uncharacterized protein [Lactobacillus hominis DSM 23910 = CRBIP 24.179]